MRTQVSHELVAATDEAIERAIEHADPLVLRGLLYQLTANEALIDMPMSREQFGFSFIDRIANSSDEATVRRLAVEFLKDLRDDGERAIDVGPSDRLPQSLGLIAGAPLPDDELGLWIEETGLDPLARGLEWKTEPPRSRKEQFQVVIVGGGISGLNAAVHLKAAGIPFLLLEKNPDVGGTWYENRYPGIRVDTPSRGYLHLFGVEYPQPYAFCPGDENLRYMQWVVQRHGLAEHIELNTEVSSMIWDEVSQTWEIEASGPEGEKSWRSNAVITCVGFLSRPQVPAIEGLETFEGVSCHTARWPADLDLTGKRVAVIGSGATGYQLTPVVAKAAEHVTLFQRTPSWCFPQPSYLEPLPDAQLWVERNVPFYANFARFRAGRLNGPDVIRTFTWADPDFVDPHARSAVNKAMRENCLAFVREKLASRPDLIDKMTPVAPPMSSRPIRVDSDDNIYTALLRDNVSLVTDPIARITPRGIEIEGEEHEFDVIALATGFRANDFLWPMEVRGRDGVRVETLWAKDGPRAYLGSMLPGFPNLFMAYGPNTNNVGGLQLIDLLEIVIRFGLQCIGGLIEAGKRSVEVTEDAYWRFNEELDAVEQNLIYMDPRAFNYYRNEHGRSSVNGPIDIRRMWKWLRDPAGTPAQEPDADVKPWFGEDLIVN